MLNNLELKNSDLVDITNTTSAIGVDSTSSISTVTTTENATPITSVSNSYSIVNDALYVKSQDDIPTWFEPTFVKLLNLQGVVKTTDLLNSIGQVMNSINIVTNGYEGRITSLEDASGSYQIFMEQLNASYKDIAEANIRNLMYSYATKDEAGAIVTSQLDAVFHPSAGETYSSALARSITSAVANATGAYASSIEELATNLNDSISTNQQMIMNAQSTANGATTNWNYDSNIKVWNEATNSYITYNSGFGLVSSGTTVGSSEGEPIFDSEFWIKADKFKITSASNMEYSPFRIEGNNLYLNGNVTFSSIADASDYIPSKEDIDAAIISAENAQQQANSAINQLADISSDNILSPVEKSAVILDYNTIVNEKSGIDSQATTYGITTEKTNYGNAVIALTNYLSSLTAPVAWNNTTGNTTIVGSTFRSKFNDVYNYRQILLNAISNKAKQLADSAQATANSKATLAEVASQGYVLPAGVANAINTNTTTISGSKITTGTISAAHIDAAGITANKIGSGSASLGSGYYFALGGSGQANRAAAVVGFASSSNVGVVGQSSSGSGVHGTGNDGLYGVGWNGKNGQVGAGAGYSFHAGAGAGMAVFRDGVAPFTGVHEAIIAKDSTITIGDIVVDDFVVYKEDISNTLTEVVVATTEMCKSCVGVYSSDPDLPFPLALGLTYENSSEYVLNPIYKTFMQDYRNIHINSLGEGQVNVCGLGGNLEVGDLITTSTIPGKGMKQEDDIVRSYTVAKCRENVEFDYPEQVKMVACIYMCG